MTTGGAQMPLRRALLIAVVSTAIVGGSAATAHMIAGPAELQLEAPEPTTTTSDTTTTSTVPGDDGDAPETGDDEESDAPADRFYEGCGDFTEGTHGDFVRAAAQAEGRTGQSVRDAARSPCGKPAQSVHDEQPPAADEPATAPAPQQQPSAPAARGNGNGNGNANGHAPGGPPGQSGAGSQGAGSQGRGPNK